MVSIGTQQGTLTPVGSAIVIASQTLHPGGSAVTISGETHSLPSSGSGIVVVSGTMTSTEGLGGYIWGGIGGSDRSGAGDTPATYTGPA